MSEKGFRNRLKEIRVTRRGVIKGLMATLTLALVGCRPGQEAQPNPTQATALIPETTPLPTEVIVSVDAARLEVVDQITLPHAPDTHTSVLPDPNTPEISEVYFSAGVQGYRAKWVVSEDGEITVLEEPTVISKPDKTISTNYGHLGYSAISSVVAPTNQHRIGFVHQEFHTAAGYFPFHAQIAITVSSDGGHTWTGTQPIITRPFPIYEPDRVTGVGQPSAIIIGDDIFLYHTEWLDHKHSIQIKKAPIDQAHEPSAWESIPSQPSLEPSDTDEVPDTYKALPGVQYLPAQNCYLMCYETSNGFYTATSPDGISWSDPSLIFQQPKRHDQRETGDVWYSYPTLVPTTEDGTSGILLCSQGIWRGEPHKMVKMPYTVQTA